MTDYTRALRTSLTVTAIVTLGIFSSACSLFGPHVETEVYTTDDGAVIVESVKLTHRHREGDR